MELDIACSPPNFREEELLAAMQRYDDPLIVVFGGQASFFDKFKESSYFVFCPSVGRPCDEVAPVTSIALVVMLSSVDVAVWKWLHQEYAKRKSGPPIAWLGGEDGLDERIYYVLCSVIRKLTEVETMVNPDRVAEYRGIQKLIGDWMGGLDERTQTVLERRFGLDGDHPHTLEEVGKELGVTRERIRQIEMKAIKRLRNKADRDPDFRNCLLEARNILENIDGNGAEAADADGARQVHDGKGSNRIRVWS